MRAIEILQENTLSTVNNLDIYDYSPETVNSLVSFIKKNCKPWLSETIQGQLYVYRGVSSVQKIKKPVSFIKSTRTDRNPLNTDITRAKAFNLLINIVGGKANRNNSIFCTGSELEARTYGPVFITLPIGNFNYTWSPRWFDWTISANTNALKELVKFWGEKPVHDDDLLDPKNYNLEQIQNIIKVDVDLKSAIKTQRELMIKCDSALYLSPLLYTNKILPLLSK